MKKFLLIYPNQQEVGCKPPAISCLSAVVKGAGHGFKLLDMTPYEIVSGIVSKEIGEERFEYKKVSNPERLPPRTKISLEEFKGLLRRLIEDYRPDLIGFTTIIHFFPMAKKLGTFIKTFSSVPIIVGGVHPTARPDEVIGEPFVDMLCMGEGEGALVELLNRMDEGKGIETIRNLWVKSGKKIIKNELRPIVDNIDTLPLPDWSDFPDIQFYKPYMGHVYKYGDIERSRGCPFNCAYCINPYTHSLYGKKSYYRAKSTSRMMEELHFLKDKYSLEFLRFWDELFVENKAKFAEFSRAYAREIALPFTIETTGESIDDETARLLKDMNCQSASIGFETGSEDLRRRILNKKTKNEVYLNAFRTLKKFGIRTVAFIMLALPEDNEQNYWDTIRFLKDAEADTICVSFLYPFRNTMIRDKFGDVYEKLYPHIDEDVANTKLDIYPILTDVSKEQWLEMGNLMPIYKEVPEWLWPLVNRCARSNDAKDKAYFQFLKKLIYKNKYGEWPDKNDAGVLV
ncbi:MAG: radical SAM protein [Candidatus Omnitrophota bacterium]